MLLAIVLASIAQHVSCTGVDFSKQPIAQNTGEVKSATVSLSYLKAGGLMLDMNGFDFEASFEILDFVLSANIGGWEHEANWNDGTKPPAKSIAKFSANQKRIINQLKRGDKIYIHSIKVKGPAGDQRVLQPIMLKIT